MEKGLIVHCIGKKRLAKTTKANSTVSFSVVQTVLYTVKNKHNLTIRHHIAIWLLYDCNVHKYLNADKQRDGKENEPSGMYY